MPRKIKRVIVTRPEQQAQSWIARIQEAGLVSAYIPALTIHPLEASEQQQVIRSAILKLDEYDWLIFISQNAVKYAFDWIDDYWPQFPDGPKCLPIGVKTRQALDSRLEVFAKKSYANDIKNTDSDSHILMNSEELLQAEYLQHVKAAKVLIFRGFGGRTKLHDVLHERGADVAHCELYQRKLPVEALPALRRQKLDINTDVLSIFSGESLSNFHELMLSENIASWSQLKIVVPSERVREQATRLGYTDVVVATNAGEDAMWNALQHVIQESEI